MLILAGMSTLMRAEIHTNSRSMITGFPEDSTKYIASTVFKAKFMEAYEPLEVCNDATECEGRVDRDIYIIDPVPFELEEDVWVKIRSNKPEDNLAANPELQAINQRLKEFNNSRTDNIRVYAVLSFGFSAYLNNTFKAPPSGDFASKGNLEKYFDDAETSNILNFLYGSWPATIDGVRQAMEGKGYTPIIFSYAELLYYSPDGFANGYKVQNLKIGEDAGEEKQQSRLKQQEKAIRKKAQQKIAGHKTNADYAKQTIENLIQAIEIIYDRKENISDKGVTTCSKHGADLDMTKPAYQAAVKSIAKSFLEKMADKTYRLGSEYVIVDQPQKFMSSIESDAILSDEGFFREILPDKLAIMDSRSDYDIYTFFTEVDFFIPQEKRGKFARDVCEEAGLIGDNMIFIITPYYSCKSNPEYIGVSGGAKPVYPLQFMPAVFVNDDALNLKMNTSFGIEKSFRSAFEQAFKYVPKDHTIYVGYIMWNGQQIFKEVIRKRVPESSNFVDVYILVDERLDKIQEYLKCTDEYNSSISLSHTSFDSKERNMAYEFVKKVNKTYVECLSKSTEEIGKIVLANPVPQFKELNSKLCTLKQSVLAGEDGMLQALFYVHASVHKAATKFWSNGKEATFEKEPMADNLFYEKKNPFHQKHWLLTPIDVGSLLTSFVGLDFIFDMAGGVVASMTGDEGEAALYFASVLVPAAIVQGVRSYKAFKVSKKAFEGSLRGEIILARSGDDVLAVGIKYGGGRIVPMKNDGVNTLRVAGIIDGNVLGAAERDPSLRSALEESLWIRNGDELAARPADGNYGFDLVRDKINDPETMNLYQKARAIERDLKLIDFLKRIDSPSKIFVLGDLSSAKMIRDKLKVEGGDDYFVLVIEWVEDNGKIKVLINGELKELDAAMVATLMRSNGYQAGTPVKLVSLVTSTEISLAKNAELADELAQNLATKTEVHTNLVKMDEPTGKLIARNTDNIVWRGYDYSHYANLASDKEMLVGHVATDLKAYIIVPSMIKPDGSVVCMMDGVPRTLSPDQLADLARKNGLREDHPIILMHPEKPGPQDHVNIARTAERLADILKTEVRRSGDEGIYFAHDYKKFRKHGVPLATPTNTPQYNPQWISTGQRKPLLLLTEANHSVDDLTEGYTVVVEEITKSGKVKYKGKEFDAIDFQKILKEEGAYNSQSPLRIVAKNIDDLNGVEKLVGNLSENNKIIVKANRIPIKGVDGSALPTKNIEWLTHAPMGKGRYYLTSNITDPRFLRRLELYDDDFLESLGQALKVNNGKYLAPFKDPKNEYWLGVLFADYREYKKVSLYSFTSLDGISKALNNMNLSGSSWFGAWRKKMYEVPLFGKNFDDGLKLLDPDAVEDLITDTDLLKRALAFVEQQTAKGGLSLPYFMAREHLVQKLGTEMMKGIEEKFVKDEGFLRYLSNELKKLSGTELDKFKRYHLSKPDDFLGEFRTLYQSQSRKMELSGYLSQAQRKSQLSLAGADKRLQDVAEQLTPQDETFYLLVRADDDGFFEVLADGNKRSIRPNEMADMLKQNENYVEGTPLKIVVNGTSGSDKPVQKLLDHLEVDAQMYRGQFTVTEGKLVGQWGRMSPDIPTKILVDETDEAIKYVAKKATIDPDYIDVIIHGAPNNFIVYENGRKLTMTARGLAGFLQSHPAFAKAMREGKGVRLISCSSGLGDAAKNLSKELPGVNIIAPNVTITVNYKGELVALEEGAFWGGFKNGEALGPISKNPTISIMVDKIAEAHELIIKGSQKNIVEIWVPGYRTYAGKGTLLEDGNLQLEINIKLGLNDAPVAKAEDVAQKIREEILKKNGAGSIKGVKP